MAYIKLTSKLRKMLEEADDQLRILGYKPDLRWLERGTCPLCGQAGGRAATLSTVAAPQANMSHIPYCVCEACFHAHYNHQAGGFGSEALEKIEAAVFAALGINPDDHYMRRLPTKFADQVAALMEIVAKEGIPEHPVWLQYHANECPGCGQTMEQPEKAGISATEVRGYPVAIPYLLCPACAAYSDDEVSLLVQDRLLVAIGHPAVGGTAH